MAKTHIVIGFPDKTDDRFLEKLYGSINTKQHANSAADYYQRFYGGARHIRVVSFSEDKEAW